jgi:hypothetical protein
VTSYGSRLSAFSLRCWLGVRGSFCAPQPIQVQVGWRAAHTAAGGPYDHGGSAGTDVYLVAAWTQAVIARWGRPGCQVRLAASLWPPPACRHARCISTITCMVLPCSESSKLDICCRSCTARASSKFAFCRHVVCTCVFALKRAPHLPLATGKGSRNFRRPVESAAMPAGSTCSADTCPAISISIDTEQTHRVCWLPDGGRGIYLIRSNQ